MRTTSNLTDDAVLAEIGRRIERIRLDRNESQVALAERAGISRATVVRLEQGDGANLKAVVRVLRALDLLEGLDLLLPEPQVSPLQQLEPERPRRQRASGARPRREPGEPGDAEGFQWGTR